jgi:hypothetical protein
MHAFLLIEIVDDRGVFASEIFEAFFAARIEAAPSNTKPAVTGFVLRQAL